MTKLNEHGLDPSRIPPKAAAGRSIGQYSNLELADRLECLADTLESEDWPVEQFVLLEVAAERLRKDKKA